MKTLATCSLLCGLLVLAACGESSTDKKDTNQGSNPPAATPPALTETIVLNVDGMT